jgi:hypothetical protein
MTGIAVNRSSHRHSLPRGENRKRESGKRDYDDKRTGKGNSGRDLGPLVNIVVSDTLSKGLFRAGYIFSVILTLAPGMWAVVAWIGTVITGKKLS